MSQKKQDSSLIEFPELPGGKLSPAVFARFARFVTAELGIKMPDSKMILVQSRLLRRVRELGIESVEEYAQYFFEVSHAEEREHFINAITTNKTDFFREPAHFAFLQEVVLPSFQLGPFGLSERFKVWSAGCSSGEEAYTIAMVLSEHAAVHPGFDFAILGTDISTKVLKLARGGVYSESLIAPVPPDLRPKYLLRSHRKADHLVRVVPELRHKVSFHLLNFMDDHYPIKNMFDVVFFRNVMIYFDKSTQEAVLRKIARNMVPGGYLFSSFTESLADLDIPLTCVEAAIYRKPEKS